MHHASQPGTATKGWRSARQALAQVVLLALVWWALTGGETRSWWFGVPVVLLAVWASRTLFPPVGQPVRWRGALLFALVFLWGSLRGGVDVALRAFHPRMPLEPTFLAYPLRLPPGPARVLLANATSLMPGTLSAELTATHLRVHALTGDRQTTAALQGLERVVGGVFGYALPPLGAARG
jgi:multicomponent Na+:H+ antiporter subunit E